ncbi:Nn.00g043340.m01.CDS01 [Neocucurbitaria sp. VM-36]
MVLSIPYLPPEVHRNIAQYISRFNLRNYRLASRDFAVIGAGELFRIITFHYSSTSLARLTAIKHSEHLQKNVRVLDWDTNLWRVSEVRDLHEWGEYFSKKGHYFKTRYTVSLYEDYHADKLMELSGEREQWEEYLDKVKDEKGVRLHYSFHELLVGFHNLRKIRIVNGALDLDHRGVKKLGDIILIPGWKPAILARGECLHMDSPRGAVLTRPGVHAFQALQTLSGLGLKKLRLDALCYQAFSLSTTSMGILHTLTSLHLRLTVQSDQGGLARDYNSTHDTYKARVCIKKGNFANFIVGLPHLESLRLDLEGRFGDDGYRYSDEILQCEGMAPSTVDDIFPLDHTWSKLRKLSLRYFDTTPDALLSLLGRHSSTLEDIRLHSIRLEADESQGKPRMCWPKVLRTISETLHLERATLSGRLESQDNEDKWNLHVNKGLAIAAAAYLVEGGESPLNL